MCTTNIENMRYYSSDIESQIKRLVNADPGITTSEIMDILDFVDTWEILITLDKLQKQGDIK